MITTAYDEADPHDPRHVRQQDLPEVNGSRAADEPAVEAEA